MWQKSVADGFGFICDQSTIRKQLVTLLSVACPMRQLQIIFVRRVPAFRYWYDVVRLPCVVRRGWWQGIVYGLATDVTDGSRLPVSVPCHAPDIHPAT